MGDVIHPVSPGGMSCSQWHQGGCHKSNGSSEGNNTPSGNSAGCHTLNGPNGGCHSPHEPRGDVTLPVAPAGNVIRWIYLVGEIIRPVGTVRNVILPMGDVILPMWLSRVSLKKTISWRKFVLYNGKKSLPAVGFDPTVAKSIFFLDQSKNDHHSKYKLNDVFVPNTQKQHFIIKCHISLYLKKYNFSLSFYRRR